MPRRCCPRPGSYIVASMRTFWVYAKELNQLLLLEGMGAVAQPAFGSGEGGAAFKNILHLAEADIVVILADQEIAEFDEKQLAFFAEFQCSYFLDEVQLWVVIKQLLQFLAEFFWTDSIVVKILKPLSQQLKQGGAVKSLAGR